MPMTLCVSGTGTDIGKTYVCLALVAAARKLGLSVVGLKPIESGGGSDAAALRAASMFHVKHPPAPYCFEEPVSPHLAARHRDTEIDLKTCVDWTWASSRGADLAIVELAGALLTPLSTRACNADLVRIMACDHWILVAPDRLGVLHDTRAALLAAESHKLPTPIVALSAPAHPDASTGSNASELEALGICAVQACFSRAAPDHPSVVSEAHRLLRAAGIVPHRSV